MSIAPMEEVDHIALRFRDIPTEHYGKVLNILEDLNKLFPGSEIYLSDTLEDRGHAGKGMKIYGRKQTITRSGSQIEDYSDIAYQCGNCRKYVVCTPRSERFNSFSEETGPVGAVGREYSCLNCGHVMYHSVEISAM